MLDLARAAARAGIGFTIDAEEADRLDLSLDIIESAGARCRHARLGRPRTCRAGLRAPRAAAARLGRGARARQRPAHERAPGQGRLLGQRDQARPGARPRELPGVHLQGGHRCQLPAVRASVLFAARRRDLPAVRDPQRLHGGRGARARPARARPTSSSACTAWARRSTPPPAPSLPDLPPVRVYAPVGTHEDLLPYLVRRLLENGANSSFVHQFLNPQFPWSRSCAIPSLPERRRGRRCAPHPRAAVRSMAPERANSAGADLGDPAVLAALEAELRAHGGGALPGRPDHRAAEPCATRTCRSPPRRTRAVSSA